MDTQLCLLSFFTMVIFLFNTFVLGSKLEQSSSTVVAIKAGQIRGKHVELSFGQAVDQFLGVPYAAAPVGQLRFAPPEDVKPWHGVRDATNYGANCPQNESPWALADGRFINVPGRGGGGVLGSILAGYVSLTSQDPYPISHFSEPVPHFLLFMKNDTRNYSRTSANGHLL